MTRNYRSCSKCARMISLDPGGINDTCHYDQCPEGLSWKRQPFLLSDAFLLRANFVMTAFNFSIMLIFFLAGLFGGT